MQLQRLRLVLTAIDRIAEDRTSDRGQMNANLVRTSGSGPAFEPGPSLRSTEHAIVGDGGLAAGIGEHAPGILSRDLLQRQIDAALLLPRRAFDDRPIDLFHAAGFEQPS